MADLSEDEEPSLASLLLDYLKEFCEDEFKEFKWHLSQKVLKDFQPIPKGQVTKLDKMDVVDLMINAFCKEGALKMSLKILKKMNQHDLAQRLEGDLQKRYPTNEGPEPTEIPPSSAAPTRGFPEPAPSSTVPIRGFPEPGPSSIAPIRGFPEPGPSSTAPIRGFPESGPSSIAPIRGFPEPGPSSTVPIRGFPEPGPSSTAPIRGFPEPGPSSTAPTRGFPESSQYVTVPPRELPVPQESSSFRMQHVARGPGDQQGPETRLSMVHDGYSRDQLGTRVPQVSTFPFLRPEQSLIQPNPFRDGPFSTHLREPSTSLQYWCFLCQGPLKDLVSTPCGHFFCRQCINSYWDQFGPSEAYPCPQCRKRSRTQPALHAHAAFAGLVQELQQEGCTPPLRARPLEMAFEDNTVGYHRPPKVGLACQAAGTQLPFTRLAVQSHASLEATGHQLPTLCQLHYIDLEGFCNTDQTFVCRLCAENEHRGHNIVCADMKQARAQAPTTSDTSSLLIHTLEKLAEEEFQQFKRTLSQDFPEYFRGPLEGYDIVDVVCKMLESCGREGALKISVRILGKFNQDSHAKSVKHRNIQESLKLKLKKRFECIFEVIAKHGSTIYLNDIYTELYITEGGSGGVNKQHEVRLIETTSKRTVTQETPIKCNDIFKPLPGQRKDVRAVLTKGIAGIGKTVSVQKFVLDWAEGKANQDLHLVFTLPFRDLNVLKGRKYSLMQLIHQYFPEMKEIENIENTKFKVLFIFDGLDECRIPLNFKNCEVWCDVTEPTSMDVLLINLIKGNLLPTALLWITSRPAAAGQIPSDCIQQLTEVRGFNDPQKEEYFMRRVSDESLAHKIISHIKSSKSLYIMCHIPVFCWISATVLEKFLVEEDSGEIPKTLTQMYTHFLLIQINIKNQKYQETSETNAKKLSQSDKEIILKLGELAFQQLEKGNLIFYSEDLKECGIDVGEASVYSGVCTEIFKEEFGLYQEKVYCFVHLSIQEYLAALYAFYLCTQENKNALNPECIWDEQQESDYMENEGEELNSANMETDQEALNLEDINEEEEYLSDEENDDCEDPYIVFCDEEPEIPFRTPLSDLYIDAIKKALQSENGHLDLFIRFLLGISLDSNQSLLKDILTPIKISAESTEVTVEYIKEKIGNEPSPERTINLFHCLVELNDNSLVEEIQTALSSGMLKDKVLEPHQCSALAYVLLMSDDVLDQFDLKTYNTEDLGHERLVPVVKSCRKAILDSCNLIDESWKIIASALMSNISHLQELNLSYNIHLEDSGMKILRPGLTSMHCKLKKLALAGCRITQEGCDALASALRSKSSHLRELDLSHNLVGDSGAKVLFAGLKSLTCKLEKLQLGECNLTEKCCEDLSSVLRSQHTALRELDLRNNDLKESGVRALSNGLKDPNCKLQKLGLSGCQVTEGGCVFLAFALASNSSQLKELDLTYNHLGESGVRLLSAGLEDPNHNLEKLLVDHGGVCRDKPGLKKYACHLELDPNTANGKLSLSEGNRKVTVGTEKQPYPDHPERFDVKEQVLCREVLSGRCYWEVEWTGGVDIAVAYKGISRKDKDSGFGYNDKSWSLHFVGKDIMFFHDTKVTSIRPPSSKFERVGVYLDWPAGILSFYCISETVTLLYTLHTKFTESLYPGFFVRPDSSASLCMLG